MSTEAATLDEVEVKTATGKHIAHEDYQPSDLEWVEQLPAHWKTERLKHIASTQFSNIDKKTRDGEKPVRLCNYVDVYYRDFITADVDFMRASATKSEVTKFRLKCGDVLITKDSEAWDDIAVPACVRIEADDLLCGYHVAQIRPREGVADGEFLCRAFEAHGVRDQFRVAAKGITRFGVGKYAIDNALFPVPPLSEQRAIASFLDVETSKIDTLVKKKERLIELLQEKRTALISHAVTKGLNPAASLKDSGVDWLGDVPGHWDVVPMRRVGEIDQGCAFSHSLQGQESGDLPWFKVQDMNRPGNEIEMRSADNYVDVELAEEIRATIFPPNAVIFPRVGAALLTNKRRILSTKAIVDDNVYGFIPSNIHPRFLYLFLLLVDMARLCSAGLVPTVTFSVIKDTYIPLPPRDEQDGIVDWVQKRTDELDALIAKVTLAIERLREYRTALISAAVTGKIDVRNHQTELAE